MKELSIEEKARRYDEAMKKVNDYYEGKTKLYSDVDKTLDYLFPALKESEDERIRKEIIQFLLLPHPQFVGNRNYEKWIAWLEKQGEQGEIDYDEELKRCKANPIYFFDKYVKVKLKEQKPAWSEEDEEMFDAVIADIQFTQKAHNHEVNQIVYEREIDWLKSIKERYTWKPSDEQMDAVKDAIDYLGCNTKKVREYLMSLYEQLKKLKG